MGLPVIASTTTGTRTPQRIPARSFRLTLLWLWLCETKGFTGTDAINRFISRIVHFFKVSRRAPIVFTDTLFIYCMFDFQEFIY
jgi:hypothetical protein